MKTIPYLFNMVMISRILTSYLSNQEKLEINEEYCRNEPRNKGHRQKYTGCNSLDIEGKKQREHKDQKERKSQE